MEPVLFIGTGGDTDTSDITHRQERDSLKGMEMAIPALHPLRFVSVLFLFAIVAVFNRQRTASEIWLQSDRPKPLLAKRNPQH